MRKMKKGLAIALSAAMVTGMSMPALAAEQEVSVDAPIFAYDVTNVIVPTSFLVAFNPNGLDVDMNGIDESNPTDGVTNNQIVSKNYGIINKSTKDKVITVTLKVEDLNEDKITFASSAADVTSATEDQYVINLTVVPADATEVKVGGNSANLTTTGADLADVTMTAATSAQQTLVAGENDVDFLLKKADYEGTIDLGSATGNNVTGAFNIKNLESTGKGITAFTFGGTMNAKADWTKLTRGIRITAVYGNDNAPDGATPETDTGALYKNPNPVFKVGSGVGVIKYKSGTGSDAISSITSVTMDYQGDPFDGLHALDKIWPAATEENGTITLSPEFIACFTEAFPDDTTRETTITYETVGGDTKTVVLNVKIRIVNEAPAFTTGSQAGTISYTVGQGNDALVSITKIEVDYNGSLFDGYHALDGTWEAATDADGVVTFSTGFISSFAEAFPSDATREVVVTYVTASGATKTAVVDFKLR